MRASVAAFSLMFLGCVTESSGSVRTDAPATAPSYDPDAVFLSVREVPVDWVREMLAGTQTQLGACARSSPKARGRLMLGFDIDRDGKVESVVVKHTDQVPAAVSSCMRDVLAMWRYHPTGSHRGASSTVTLVIEKAAVVTWPFHVDGSVAPPPPPPTAEDIRVARDRERAAQTLASVR